MTEVGLSFFKCESLVNALRLSLFLQAGIHVELELEVWWNSGSYLQEWLKASLFFCFVAFWLSGTHSWELSRGL